MGGFMDVQIFQDASSQEILNKKTSSDKDYNL